MGCWCAGKFITLIKYVDLKDFINCYNPENHFERKETDRCKKYTYEQIIAHYKTSLDIFWLKDDSLGDLGNLPEPDVLPVEIVENIESALLSVKEVVNGLNGTGG